MNTDPRIKAAEQAILDAKTPEARQAAYDEYNRIVAIVDAEDAKKWSSYGR